MFARWCDYAFYAERERQPLCATAVSMHGSTVVLLPPVCSVADGERLIGQVRDNAVRRSQGRAPSKS